MTIACRNCGATADSEFEDWEAVCPNCGRLVWLREGDLVFCTVTKILDFGVLVELGGGAQGLIHITELSDIWIGHPSEIVSVGSALEAKVLRIDIPARKIGLSVKRARSQQNRDGA